MHCPRHDLLDPAVWIFMFLMDMTIAMHLPLRAPEAILIACFVV